MEELLSGERIDELHRKGYRIIQKTDAFCFGMDAVLLSDFAKVSKKEKILDMGTGTGIIPILMEARTEGGHFTGLEIQKDFAEMAARSVAMNHQQDRIQIVCGDIKEASAIFGTGSFDVVVSRGHRTPVTLLRTSKDGCPFCQLGKNPFPLTLTLSSACSRGLFVFLFVLPRVSSWQQLTHHSFQETWGRKSGLLG